MNRMTTGRRPRWAVEDHEILDPLVSKKEREKKREKKGKFNSKFKIKLKFSENQDEIPRNH